MRFGACWAYEDEGIVVALLDDGSVCMSGLLATAEAGKTVTDGKRTMPKVDLATNRAIECVSVERHRNMASFAVGQ